MVGSAFCGAYGYVCYNTKNHQSEAIRLGIAGSIATMVCECAFHLVDTLNIRSKVTSKDNNAGKSTFQQVKQIYVKEGVYGFARGFSACFYGSIFCGFSYFALYKTTKLTLYEILGKDVNPTLVFFSASILSEMLTIIVHFPYDLIKCRL